MKRSWIRVGFVVASLVAAFACSPDVDTGPGQPIDCVAFDGTVCRDGSHCPSPDDCNGCECDRGIISCTKRGCGEHADAALPPITVPKNAIATGVTAVKLAVDATYLYWLDRTGTIFKLRKADGAVEKVSGPLAIDFVRDDASFLYLTQNAPFPTYLARAGDDGGFMTFPFPEGFLNATGGPLPPLYSTGDRALVSVVDVGLGVFTFADSSWSTLSVADAGTPYLVGEGATDLAVLVTGGPSVDLVLLDRSTLAPTHVASLPNPVDVFAFDDGSAYLVDGLSGYEDPADAAIVRVDRDGATTTFHEHANAYALITDETFVYVIGTSTYAVRKDDGGVVGIDGDAATLGYFADLLVIADDAWVYVCADDGTDPGFILRFPKP